VLAELPVQEQMTRTNRLPVAAALLLAGAIAAGCGSTATVLLVDRGDGEFTGGTPFDPRPGAGQVIYVSRGELLGVNDRGTLDHLLLEDASGLVDLAFRSHEELLVLLRNRVSIYFAGRLVSGWDIEVSADARLDALGDEIWIATNNGGQGRLLRLDNARNEFRVIAEFDRPITDVSAGAEGCYCVFVDSVYRVALNAAHTEAELVFVAALSPGDVVTGVAADLTNAVIYVATETQTFAYAGGKLVPFHPVGGRIRCDEGDLYLSSATAGSLVKIGRAYARAWSLAQ
jgi:hypothetical protein